LIGKLIFLFPLYCETVNVTHFPHITTHRSPLGALGILNEIFTPVLINHYQTRKQGTNDVSVEVNMQSILSTSVSNSCTYCVARREW